jgi:hypothetical protein
MPYPQFDRTKLLFRSLKERPNKVVIQRDAVSPESSPRNLSAAASTAIRTCAEKILAARQAQRPVILAFGAHSIKNGLAPVLIRLMENDWVTLLATNGAGIIHDWEFAFQGESSENVRENVDRGQFGIWQETGEYLNLALVVGAFEGLGYGESVGKMIERQGLRIPGEEELRAIVSQTATTDPERAAAALDLLAVMRANKLPSGFLDIPHPYQRYSAQAAAYRLNIPFTAHPMFGHDIIYTHPANHGAAIGRTAQHDFLAYAAQIQCLEGGVYVSIGSAVMSPMVFEKSLSMAQNIALQEGRKITKHDITIADLAESTWDWQKDGEPPADNPAYYLRYCKTFNRMGGEMRYVQADNRDFLLVLLRELEGHQSSG